MPRSGSFAGIAARSSATAWPPKPVRLSSSAVAPASRNEPRTGVSIGGGSFLRERGGSRLGRVGAPSRPACYGYGYGWNAIHSRTPVENPAREVMDSRSRVVLTVPNVVTLYVFAATPQV